MKKLIFILALIFSSFQVFSQVFNSAEILKPGHFSIGINPTDVERNLALYLYGGVGLSNKMDLSLRYGFFDGRDYLGADIEWALKNGDGFDISLVTGAHDFGDFGLDIGIIASISVGKYATILSGLDSDIYLNSRNNERHFWIPFGVEVSWRDNISLIIEADIPASEWAPHIFGGGVVFYLP